MKKFILIALLISAIGFIGKINTEQSIVKEANMQELYGYDINDLVYRGQKHTNAKLG